MYSKSLCAVETRARKKCSPEQVDFPSGQVCLHSLLPNRTLRQVVCQLSKKKILPGASKICMRATCLKAIRWITKVFFVFVFEPWKP